MTDPQALLEPFRTQLQHELQLTRQFLEILHEEAQLLETGQPDDLSKTTELKENAAQHLQSATLKRATLLASLGLPNNLQGVRAAAGRIPELAPLVENLAVLSEQARHQNEQNGEIIDALLTNTQRMMAALQTLTGRNTVYDASGKKQAAPVTSDIPRLKPLKAG